MDHLDELRAILLRHRRHAVPGMPIPRVGLMHADAPTTPTCASYEPIFCVVAQGAKRVMLGERVFEYGAGSYFVVSTDLPVIGGVCEASAAAPYLGIGLKLDRALLADALLDIPAGTAPAPAAGMAVGPVPDDLLEPVVRLARLLDRPADIAVLAPLIEREILYRLALGPQGATLRQITAADSKLARIARAIRWIAQNYAEALSVDALADLAGMSRSSFHRHFRAVTSMSPLQYQKRIRLQEARRLLFAAEADAMRVGFAVGYESPSQFSREYGRLFGAPPGRDAARLRALPARDPQRMAEPL